MGRFLGLWRVQGMIRRNLRFLHWDFRGNRFEKLSCASLYLIQV